MVFCTIHNLVLQLWVSPIPKEDVWWEAVLSMLTRSLRAGLDVQYAGLNGYVYSVKYHDGRVRLVVTRALVLGVM